MKEIFLTTLRQASTKTAAFRQAAHSLSQILAVEASTHLPHETVKVHTPVGEAIGFTNSHRIILVPILRSGLAMLPSFQELFPTAPIGFFGIKRDEATANPHLYYQNLPKILPNDWVILIDPMLATGGSATIALNKLEEAGTRLNQTLFISIISSQQGVDAIRSRYAQIRLMTGATDPGLNSRKFIVPGLGDFGDRYFET